MIGTTLNNRYTITAELGSGAMGVVFKANDHHTGQEVAVKVLTSALSHNSQFLRRFEREARSLADLKHPNIVPYVDSFTEGVNHFIVMAYMRGGSLGNRLDTYGAIPHDEAVQIAIDIADALIRAHRLGIIHRDIKPDNILFDDNGTPYLGDFGVAGDENAQGTQLTGTGTPIGTPFYMSPEAWRGETQDAQSDIWSFGVVLYEMLTGVPPFNAASRTDLIQEILVRPMPDIRKVKPSIPTGTYQILQKALAKDKIQRYPNMRQLSADLESGTPAVPMKGAGVGYRGQLAMATVLLLLLVAGVGLGLVLLGGDDDPNANAAAEISTASATTTPSPSETTTEIAEVAEDALTATLHDPPTQPPSATVTPSQLPSEAALPDDIAAAPTDSPSPTDEPTATASATPSQTATVTSSPSPTDTPEPTATPSLTATATPSPSDTPEPSATATVTPSATATPDRVIIENVESRGGVEVFPEPDRNSGRVFAAAGGEFAPFVAGINAEGDWLYIYYFLGSLNDGWAPINQLELDDDQIASLAVIDPDDRPALPEIEYNVLASRPFGGGGGGSVSGGGTFSGCSTTTQSGVLSITEQVYSFNAGQISSLSVTLDNPSSKTVIVRISAEKIGVYENGETVRFFSVLRNLSRDFSYTETVSIRADAYIPPTSFATTDSVYSSLNSYYTGVFAVSIRYTNADDAGGTADPYTLTWSCN